MICLKEELVHYKPTLEIKDISEEEFREEEIQDIIDIVIEHLKKSNE